MKHEITTDRVLKAAEGCKDAEKVLKTLFPEAFEDQEVFCHVDDILIRKGINNCFYQITYNTGMIQLSNLSLRTSWSNIIKPPFNSTSPQAEKLITRECFKNLIKSKARIEHFKVLKRRDLDELF